MSRGRLAGVAGRAALAVAPLAILLACGPFQQASPLGDACGAGRESNSDSQAVPEEYKGLSLDEARALAESKGLELRLLGEDGQCVDRTDNSRPDRVNVHLREGVVDAASGY